MNQRQGVSDRLFTFCFGIFVAAGLLYLGVQLIELVLPWLLVIGGIAIVGAAIVGISRRRRERW